MQIAIPIVLLLIVGAFVGSLINFAAPFLGIPLALIFVGAVIGREGLDRQRRIMQMKRFRKASQSKRGDFTAEDKRTMI